MQLTMRHFLRTGIAPLFQAVCLLMPLPALAEPGAAVGVVTHLAGTLSATRADGSRVLLSTRSAVREGDTLGTADSTYARVKFADDGEVVLRPNTVFKIERFGFEPANPEGDGFLVSLLKGGLRAVSGIIAKRNQDRVGYTTTDATIGIRGTHFGALLCHGDCAAIPTVTGRPLEEGLHVDVAAGAISLENPTGELRVETGQFAHVRDISTPPVIVPAAEGVRVTMPSIISQNDSGGRALDDNKSEDQCKVP